MNLSEFTQAVKDNAAKVEAALKGIFDAHPELEADLAQGATDAVSALKSTAESQVEQAAPAAAPTADDVLDILVAKIDARLADDIAQSQATAAAQKAAIASLREPAAA